LAGAAAWALIVARGWLAFEITDSSLWVGLVTFMAMAPRFFATPIIGFIADRFDRQMVLSWTYALNLTHNLVLAVLVMIGLAGPWMPVALALINGTLRSSQQTATQSLVPNLVPKEHLLNAVALNEATQQGSRLAGPAAITPLLLLFNTEAAFWLCSAFYLVGLIQTLRISTRSRGKVERNRTFSENFLAGFNYVYSTPIVLAMVLLAVFHCSLTCHITPSGK
jgi:MFS family permease